jgi:hypothetical protein
MKFLSFSQTKLGSSFDITRARVGGASVIPLLPSLLFSVPPSVRRKVLGVSLFSGINSAKQAGKKEGGWGEGIFARLLPFPFRLSKGKAEGGFGGNSAFPLRNQIEASPATCLNTWRAEHRRKILFSLKEEKIGRAQNEKSKEYFSVVWRACRAVAGLASLLGVLLKISSNINQKTPPSLKLRRMNPQDMLKLRRMNLQGMLKLRRDIARQSNKKAGFAVALTKVNFIIIKKICQKYFQNYHYVSLFNW